jgi:hypothetical protein
MFTDNQSLTNFIRTAFPELSAKLLFSVMVGDDGNGKRNAVLFFDNTLTEEEKRGIKEFLRRFPEIGNVSFPEKGQLPLTDLLVLREIKTYQPLDYDALLTKLKDLRVSFEEIDLKRMLDKLRKAKMIIRSHSGRYSVTERALSSIPHGNHRNSSDIQRLLDLGRRKW